MKGKGKNDIPEESLPKMRLLTARINTHEDESNKQLMLQKLKSLENSCCIFAKSDLENLAKNERLFINPTTMSEKDKKDKTLIGLPKEATPDVLACAYQLLIDSSFLTKRKDKFKHLTLQAELKTKLEKTQKSKPTKEQTETPIPFFSAVQPNTFEELFLMESATVLIIFTDYPSSEQEYNAFFSNQNSFDYFINFGIKKYAKTSKFPLDLNQSEIKFQESHLLKEEIILSSVIEADKQACILYKIMTLKSPYNSLFKKNHSFDFWCNLIEDVSEKIQLDECVIELMKTIEEFQAKKTNFENWKATIKTKKLVLDLENSTTQQLQKIIKTTRKNIKKYKLVNQKIDVSKLLNSIEMAFDKTTGFETQPLISETSLNIEKAQIDKEKKENEVEYFIEKQVNNFHECDLSQVNLNEKTNSDKRKVFASIIPFFDLHESQISNKLDLLEIQEKMTNLGLNFDTSLYNETCLEVLSKNLYRNQQYLASNYFLSEFDFSSSFSESKWSVFYNKIDFDSVSLDSWNFENNLMPHFSYWLAKYENAAMKITDFYDYDYGRIGDISQKTSRIFTNEREFVTNKQISVGRFKKSWLSLNTEDMEVFFNDSKVANNHFHYYETSEALNETLYQELKTQQDAFVMLANKNQKDKKAEMIKGTPIPEAFIHSHFWKKPLSSELLLHYKNQARIFAEVEPYFDLEEVSKHQTDKNWFSPTIDNIDLQQFIKFGQSVSLEVFGKSIKFLPSGNLLFQINGKTTLITKKGHVILYLNNDKNKEKASNIIRILHPNGSMSIFEDKIWKLIRKDGKIHTLLVNG